jgi:hypothetical protein
MAHRAKKSEAANIVESYEIRVEHRIADEIALIKYSIKDEYKDQFEKAIEVAQHHLKQGVPKKEIVNLLNDSGFRTITGKKWSYSTLANEFRKLNNKKSMDK